MFLALEKAKEAVKRDSTLQKHMESHSLLPEQLRDLSFTSWFHLAIVYEKNSMYQESIEAYSYLLRQKISLACVGRIRINIGNIHYLKHDYTEAITMYRMALDQTPRENVVLIKRIYKSIANSFFRLGKLRDAIRNYETSSNSTTDVKTSFNLLLCYVKVGDEKKSREMLQKIAATIIRYSESQGTDAISNEEKYDISALDSRSELSKDRKEKDFLLLTAARLLVTLYAGDELFDVFHWIIAILGDHCPSIAVQIKIEQAIQYLRRNEFSAAMDILKSYVKGINDTSSNDAVLSNLSFMCFLQGNYDMAEEYANEALSINKYNHNALVNKGNCCFVQGDLVMAKTFYSEAIKLDCNSIEAIYNAGITSIRLNKIEDAREAFQQLHSILPHDPRVLYQIATLYELEKNITLSIKWFNVLSTSVTTDANLMSRLGQLYSESEESQSAHFYLESYRCYPANLDTIGWLAVWFVKNGMYEKSIQFFEHASNIQPNIHKWQLMMATCYRKTGKTKLALQIYERINAADPENIECKNLVINFQPDQAMWLINFFVSFCIGVKALISICKEIGASFNKYEKQLEHLTRGSAV